MTVRRVAVEGGEIALLGCVQGLASEAQRVADAFAQVQPAAVALGVSPESAAALLRHDPKADVDLFDGLADHEAVYAKRLSEYGPIDLPPPDLAEAARLAADRSISVYGVDLTEEGYVRAFTKNVSYWALLRYGRIQRRLSKRPPAAPDARAFSLAWDAEVRRIPGLDRVETAREEAIAQNARALAKQTPGGPVLLIVDAPRADGVQRRLSAPE